MKSSRRTPKSKNLGDAAKPKKAPILPSTKPTDADDEDDLLASTVSEESGVGATTKKRKFAGDGKTGRGTKKPRMARDDGKEKTGVIKKGRTTQHKPATSGYNPETSQKVVQAKNVIEKELSFNMPKVTAPNVIKDNILTYRVNEESGKIEQSKTDDDHRPEHRNRVTKPKATRDPKPPKRTNPVPAVSVEATETLADVAPTKKRKKRRSIGQQSMRAKKRPSSETKKDMLPQMEESIPSALGIEPHKLHASMPKECPGNSAPSRGNETAPPVSSDQAPRNNALKISEGRSDIPVTHEESTLRPKPQIKRKPRKKRKPIAQVRKPKKPLKKDNAEAATQKQITADKHQPTCNKLATTSVNEAKGRPRKPLANVTNIVKDVKAKSSASNTKDNTASKFDSIKALQADHITPEITQPSAPLENPSTRQSETPDKQKEGLRKKRSDIPEREAPPKKRARPRKQPQTAPLPPADEHPPAEPQTAPKPTRRATKKSKPPAASIPITVYGLAPTGESDSDDPLSLSSHYPPKKAPNAIDVLAQVSQEILAKQRDKDEVSVAEKRSIERYEEELRGTLKGMSALVDENEALKKAVRVVR